MIQAIFNDSVLALMERERKCRIHVSKRIKSDEQLVPKLLVEMLFHFQVVKISTQ